jgi:aminoglycoside 6-adenylyltransferase
MRNEYDLIQELLQFSLSHAAVRAMLLTGSRANPFSSTDELSDFDIELIADDLNAFKNDEWYLALGNTIGRVKIDHPDYSTRLVLYEDGTRIDFQIYTESEFERKNKEKHARTTWDVGYVVLLDKDGICSKMRKPVFNRFFTLKPGKNDFAELVNDFWWDTTYVAKSLWRNELFFAKYMMESVIRFSYLSPLIEWRISNHHHWAINPDKYGRKFQEYLSAEDWARVEKTFGGSGVQDNWKALFNLTDLFHDWATALARDLDYVYPQQLDERMSSYLRNIYHLKPGKDQLQQTGDL